MDTSFSKDILQQTQSRFVHDLQSLDQLRQQGFKGKEQEQQALRQAAQQFESIFMSQLLASMRKANEIFSEGNPLNSEYTKFYENMYDQQLSSELASSGSLGLADLIVQQLSPESSHHYTPASLLPSLESQLAGRGIFAKHKLPQEEKIPSLTERIPALRFALDEGDWQAQSPVEFLERLAPYAKEAAEKAGVSPVTILAQAALETGWGQHVIPNENGQSSNNIFNIKANSVWQGEKAYTRTEEYVGQKRTTETAAFRAYQNVAESFQDYVAFLQGNPRYQQALQVGKDAFKFAEQLQQAGYATDPEYAAKIKRIIQGDAMQSVRLKLGL